MHTGWRRVLPLCISCTPHVHGYRVARSRVGTPWVVYGFGSREEPIGRGDEIGCTGGIAPSCSAGADGYPIRVIRVICGELRRVRTPGAGG